MASKLQNWDSDSCLPVLKLLPLITPYCTDHLPEYSFSLPSFHLCSLYLVLRIQSESILCLLWPLLLFIEQFILYKIVTVPPIIIFNCTLHLVMYFSSCLVFHLCTTVSTGPCMKITEYMSGSIRWIESLYNFDQRTLLFFWSVGHLQLWGEEWAVREGNRFYQTNHSLIHLLIKKCFWF